MKVFIVTEQWSDSYSASDPEVLKIFDSGEKADIFVVDFIKRKWRDRITEFLFPEIKNNTTQYKFGKYYYRIQEFEVE